MSAMEKLIKRAQQWNSGHVLASEAQSELTELRQQAEAISAVARELSALLGIESDKFCWSDLTLYVEQLKAERDKLKEGVEGMAGNAGAWPFRDVLTVLIEAVAHLQQNHDCDCHGHENYWRALEVAPQYLNRLDALLEKWGKG